MSVLFCLYSSNGCSSILTPMPQPTTFIPSEFSLRPLHFDPLQLAARCGQLNDSSKRIVGLENEEITLECAGGWRRLKLGVSGGETSSFPHCHTTTHCTHRNTNYMAYDLFGVLRSALVTLRNMACTLKSNFVCINKAL